MKIIKDTRNNLCSDDIYLRYPRLVDYKKWRSIRESSKAFLTPWEPTWHPGEHSLKRYLKLLSIYSQKRKNNTQYSYFIFNKKNDLLGGINVFNIKSGISQSCTLGYWIGEVHSNQGYMTKSLILLLRHLFNNFNFNRVEAACLPNNVASKSLLERLGFDQEGYAKDYLRINGRWEDHILFSLRKKIYNDRRKT